MFSNLGKIIKFIKPFLKVVDRNKGGYVVLYIKVIKLLSLDFNGQ